MLSHSSEPYGNYGLSFTDTPTPSTASILFLGWEKQTSTAYSWDGRKRYRQGPCLFKYTLSGWGFLEHEGRTERIGPGQAMLLEFPGEHRYYLPSESESWEYLYIILHGEELHKHWLPIKSKLGATPELEAQSPLIQLLYSHYRLAQGGKISDGYQSAALGYQFLMELYRTSKYYGTAPEEARPKAVAAAIHFIDTHYSRTLGLEELAAAAGLSKYHFARLFRQSTGLTPVEYITKIRMRHAVQLLLNSGLPIAQIAMQTGFASGNYFGKVFHEWIGMSPGQFRESTPPIDHLLMD